MSHAPLRKENDCLNCGTLVQGRYCHKCGQENTVPKETFWHMVTHFFYDITHFDSKFFETMKDLVFKPGFLSREYMKGKRASYLHPVKMYVFTSAVFFLLFFGIFASDANVKMDTPDQLSGIERLEELDELTAAIMKDSALVRNDSLRQKKLDKIAQMRDTTKPVSMADFAELDLDMVQINISGVSNKFKTTEEYDSAQRLLPKSERDGWLRQRLVKKEISVNKRYRHDPRAAFDKLTSTVLHRLPYMLFVSLPLFALILKLLYIRRRQFYYADHGIFTIHLYIFSFILLAVVFGLNELQELTNLGFIGYVMAALFIALNFYLYKAMRLFYGQRRFKTFIKFLLVAFLSLIMMVALLAIFFFFTAFEL